MHIFLFLLEFLFLFQQNVTEDSLEADLSGISGIEKINTLNYLSEAYRLKKPERSLEFALEAYDIARENGINDGFLSSSLNIGETAFLLEKYNLAKGYFLSALDLLPIDKLDRGYLNLLSKIRHCFFQLNDYDKAIRYNLKELEGWQKFGDNLKIVYSLNNIGVLFKRKGEFQLALDYFEGAMRASKSDSADIIKYEAMVNAGIILNERGVYDKALDYFFEANEFFMDKDIPGIKSFTLVNLGQLYKNIGQTDRAVYYFRKAIKIEEEEENPEGISSVSDIMGTIYKLRSEPDSALGCFLRSLTINEQLTDSSGMAASLGNLGDIYSMKESNNRALDYYTRSLNIRKKLGERSNLAITYLKTGMQLIKMQFQSQGAENLKQCVEIAREEKLYPVLSSALRALSDFYRKTGRFREALDYQIEYQAMNDSMVLNAANAQIKELDFRYSQEQKTRENELLKRETEIQQLQIERQESLVNTLLIFSGIVIFLGIIIISKYSANQKINRRLKEQNKFITNQKEELAATLEKLYDSDLKLRAIYDNAADGILIVENAVIWYTNNKMSELCGYPADEIIGKNIESFIAPEYRKKVLEYHNRRTLGENVPYSYETLLLHKSGRAYEAEIKISKIRFEGRPAFLATVRDITERKSFENELMHAKNEAEKSDRLKSEFLAQMSHEIRTPVSTIINYCSLMREEIGRGTLDEEWDACLQSINSAGRRIIRTMDLLINMSEMLSGSYDYNPLNIDIYTYFIEKLFPEYKILAEEKNISLNILRFTDNTFVTADEYSVNQIFNNLLDNAIKYTLSGKVEVIFSNDSENSVLVEIKDTGIGIAEEFVPNLF